MMLIAVVCLYPALVGAFLPSPRFSPRLHVRRSSDLAISADSESSEPTESPKGTNERFQLVYTCNVCETRNLVEVQRVAWEDGVVISTCQGCENKHILSDAKGLMDRGNWTNFSNVVNSIGATKLNLPGMDPSELEALGLKVGENGTMELLARAGEEVLPRKERISAVRKVQEEEEAHDAEQPPPPSDVDSASEASSAFVPGEGQGETSEGGTVAAPASAFTIAVPPGAGAGDQLQVALQNGQCMLVPVPKDFQETSPSGTSKLAVEGAIEFMVLAEQVGELADLETPSGEKIRIKIPDDTEVGSLIQVAYPIRVVSEEQGFYS